MCVASRATGEDNEVFALRVGQAVRSLGCPNSQFGAEDRWQSGLSGSFGELNNAVEAIVIDECEPAQFEA